MSLEAFNRARAAIARRGFDADTQSRITLFVNAAKSVNATFLATLDLVPGMSVAQEFVHSQYFREVELASLLGRATQWTPNPLVYLEGQALATPLWAALWSIQAPPGPLQDEQARYRGLALGHALLARVRLTPVIPADADELTPYVVALRRLDQESGRQIQTQIRLLQDAPVALEPAAREAIVQEEQARVDTAFARLLDALAH
jgi:hypothetical protein